MHEKSRGVGRFVPECVALRALIRSIARACYMHFEMYLLVILPFYSALLGEVLPYISYTRMSSLKGYEKYDVDLGPSQTRYCFVFFTLVLS